MKDSVLRSHVHERAYVSVLVEGAYTELHDGLPRYCAPGTVLPHAAGEVHADYFFAPGRCVNFVFREDDRDWQEHLVHAVRATHPSLERAVRNALFPPHQPNAVREPEWLRAVLDEFPWIEPVPIEHAARLAGTHPAHFARAFHKHVGMTPGRYRRRERVRAASRMLLESSRALSEIANECGFADQSHLTNVFRESAGISPNRYRGAFTR
ncbi:MAG TPA: helix-turn-helix transcriptional regulator [Candidatus Limnocylindrales bacterium]|nr:helix-turn-helix transcriptional regulator [Candidatus Limnocylindrales bacterium]